MIATLALSALAGPPRAEVLAGWSGNGTQSYGYATVQPALLGSRRARLLVRGTISRLHYSYTDGADVTVVDAPGLTLGPAVVFPAGDLTLVAGLGFGGRRASTRVEDAPLGSVVTLDALLTGDLFWRPGQRANLYTQASLGAAGRTVWARAGAMVPVTPRDRAVSLWLGLEGTSSGPFPTLAHEVGPVAEVPIAPLHASLAVRASVPARDPLAHGLATFGIAAYWAY